MEATTQGGMPGQTSSKMLKIAATSWLSVAVLGQILFFLYIVAFYFKPTLMGDFEHWNKVLPNGFVKKDPTGNLMLAAHLLLAAFVTFGGVIQVIPFIRHRFPGLHRWNGRVYILMAMVISIAGIYLVTTRGAFGGPVASWALGVNGVLIIAFGGIAWRYARIQNYALHGVWAFRMFLAASGVWFFRVGLMLWLFIFRAPVGFDPETFTGPLITFLYFSCYLLPLTFWELYLYAQKQKTKVVKSGIALLFLFVTLLMAFGIMAVAVGLWWPRIV